MSDPFDALEPRTPAPAAGERRARRRRIFGLPRRGWRHDEIAEAEDATIARVRAIVAQTLALRWRNPVAKAFRLQAFDFGRSSWQEFGGGGRLGGAAPGGWARA